MKLKVWLASLLLAIVPAVAGAVTLIPGGAYDGFVGFTFNPATGFDFDNIGGTKPLKVENFSLTFNSSTNAALTASTWTVTPPGGTGIATNFVPSVAGGKTAMINLPNFIVNVGESFNVAFSLVFPTDTGGTSGSFSFDVAAIPLPAAGWMLLSAIGGMGFLARRRAQTV